MNAQTLAKAVLEGEDPKYFLMRDQDERRKQARVALAAFCNDVEELLQATDAGNAEDWPPPEGFPDDGDFGDAGYSRWNHVWRGLKKVREAFRVHAE